MKKLLTILLLLPLFYTQLGYYGQFILLQWQMKEAAREAWIMELPDAAFLKVSLAEVNATGKWEEAGKECWYKGHLYDVIRQQSAGNDTFLYCMDDESEERLIHQSEQVTRANQDHPDKKTGHALTLSIGDIVCERPSLCIAPAGCVWQPYTCSRSWRLPFRYTEILVPPPKA